MLVRIFGVLGLLVMTGVAVAAGQQVRMEGEYLFVEAEQVSLTQVFQQVGEVTGATVQVSPKVERTVSVSVPGRKLQQAMDALARQFALNIVLGWQKDSDGQSRLSSIDVLPDGTMDPAALEREEARNQRILNQQKSNRAGQAVPGGVEDKSWWRNREQSGGADGRAGDSQ